MNKDFSEALAFVLEREGGITNDAADRGGLTNYGITQAEYSADLKLHGLANNSVAKITKLEVERIYYFNYWLASEAHQLARPLGIVHFDGAVNIGPRWAAKLLQRAVLVVEDSVIGPKTLAAVKARTPQDVADALIRLRRAYYRAIVAHTPSQSVFLLGWLNRCDALDKVIS